MLLDPMPDVDEPAYDQYLNVEVAFDRGTGEERRGRVVKRLRGPDGAPIGRANKNPIFDTRQYEVAFEDGTMGKYHANIIAENMFAQVDRDGVSLSLLKGIVDHRFDDTVIPKEDGFITAKNGNKVPKMTTRGCEVLMEMKDGDLIWTKLKDAKESNPIELAEYAVANRIADMPCFHWWVPHTLRKRNRIISKVKSRYWRTSHKFGVRLPKNVEEAYQIDKETGTTFWTDAINKEMAKVKVAWEARDDVTPEQVRDGKVPDLLRHQEIGCHIVFDCKMDFTRKARFVAGGHTTETPTSLTYSSVVSRDSIRLGFLIAALNGLDIMACDLENAYLNAPCKEKIWFEGGLECGEDQGKVLVVTRALYGLKGSGNSWRNALSEAIQNCGFKPTLADPDVYLRKAVKPDGMKYYEMLFVYVDDILCLSHKAREVINEIGEHYKIKPGSDKEPDLYLGANVEKVQCPDGREVWATSARDYVANAIETVKALLKADGLQLKSKARSPLPSQYKPEVDVSDELGPELASRYAQLMGILRWAVELGRIDIYLEVSLMSQYQANPRVGHLDALYHMFAYLNNYKGQKGLGRLRYDPTMPPVDYSYFEQNRDWTDFYGHVEEELPPRMPEPLGNPVTIFAFVDANHAGNVVTRRSHTGIIIYVNNAPIIFYSKRQNTVESATFGSEFVALRICKDLIVALRYKLRMFGVPLDGPAPDVAGPAYVFCDNKGVVSNASIPESTLSKKHNAINYHAVREAVAAGIIRVGKEDGNTNLADLLTKVLEGQRRWDLVGSMTY